MRPSPPTQQQSPHPQHGQMMPGQPFMGPRYPTGPRGGPGVRMPMGSDFNGPTMSNNLDPTRQGPPGMTTMGEHRHTDKCVNKGTHLKIYNTCVSV